MHDEMMIDDAINVANVGNDLLIDHAAADVRELAIAAKRLVNHVGEQSREVERAERDCHRKTRGSWKATGLKKASTAVAAATFWRASHAGQTLYLLACAGWHAVRYESNMPHNAPVLYLPLPGVQTEVVLAVPRGARFAWPEELEPK